MISTIVGIKNKYDIEISEGENFKQAYYNGRLTDNEDQVKEKIELAIKHYPNKNLIISTYESDEYSPVDFAFAVIMPVMGSVE